MGKEGVSLQNSEWPGQSGIYVWSSVVRGLAPVHDFEAQGFGINYIGNGDSLE